MLGPMLDPKEIIFGLSAKHIAQVCGVDITTARRWKRGAICPPQSALFLLSGDLGFIDRAWAGWCIKRGLLISPEGWEATPGHVRYTRLHETQIASYQSQIRRLKAELEAALTNQLEEQPRPDEWTVQIVMA